MTKAKKVVKKVVAKATPKNEFKVVRKDDSRIKTKIDDGAFDDECCYVVLIDNASRTALNLSIGDKVIVKKGVNKETATVEVQFDELVGKKSATLNDKLGDKLGVAKNDTVTIEKVE